MQLQGPTGNSISQTSPLGTPGRGCHHSGLLALSGGAQPPMLQAPLLSSCSTVMTKGTTPTMGLKS